MKFTNQKLALLLAVIAFILNCITYSPGFMFPDSLDQYRQALSNEYVEWHPTVMAYLWHLLNYIHKGPQIVLAFQMMLLWSSFYMIATAADNKKWTSVVFVVFYFAPFIHNFSGYIVKDVHMALCWLLAVSILIKYYAIDKKVPALLQIATVALLMYGSWVRYNSLSALYPICIIWAWVIFRNRKTYQKVLIALALFISVIVGQKVFLKWLNPYKSYPQDVLYMHDLSAMLVKTGENVFPPIMYQNPQFDTAYIRAKFHPAIYDDLWWNPDNKQLIILNDSVTDALHDAWVSMIKRDTKQYLANRWETFTYFLRFKEHTKLMYMFPWIHPNEFGYIVKEERIMYKLYHTYMQAQEDAFYLQTWFWVILNIVLLLLVPIVRNKKLQLVYTCVLVSGILYLLPQYFLITTDKEFRYIYWVCIASMLGMLVLLLDRVKASKKIAA